MATAARHQTSAVPHECPRRPRDIHSFIHSFIHPFIHSFLCLFIPSFVRTLVLSFVRLFVRLFTRCYLRTSAVLSVTNGQDQSQRPCTLHVYILYNRQRVWDPWRLSSYGYGGTWRQSFHPSDVYGVPDVRFYIRQTCMEYLTSVSISLRRVWGT